MCLYGPQYYLWWQLTMKNKHYANNGLPVPSFQLHYIQIQHTITYIDECVCTVHAGFHLPVLSVLDKVYVGGTLAAVCLCTITYTPTHVYYMHTLQACIPSTCRLVSDKCYSTWYSSCSLRMYSVVWAICCSYSATSALVL